MGKKSRLYDVDLAKDRLKDVDVAKIFFFFFMLTVQIGFYISCGKSEELLNLK